MGRFFFFLDKPELIPDDMWATFLDGMAAMAAFVVLATVGVTILSYVIAARRRKVHVPDDLFAPFTPMYSLFGRLQVRSRRACFASRNTCLHWIAAKGDLG